VTDAEDDFDEESLCTATPHFVIAASETGWNVQAKATEAGRPDDDVFITISGNNFAEVRRPGRIVRPWLVGAQFLTPSPHVHGSGLAGRQAVQLTNFQEEMVVAQHNITLIDCDGPRYVQIAYLESPPTAPPTECSTTENMIHMKDAVDMAPYYHWYARHLLARRPRLNTLTRACVRRSGERAGLTGAPSSLRRCLWTASTPSKASTTSSN